MAAHAGLDVLEALAALAAAGGAEAREVVLLGLHVAVAVAAPVAERAGLHHHLVEGIVPAHAELLAEAHVLRGDGVVAQVEMRIALLEELHQPAGRDALRHRVAGARHDLWQVRSRG